MVSETLSGDACRIWNLCMGPFDATWRYHYQNRRGCGGSRHCLLALFLFAGGQVVQNSSSGRLGIEAKLTVEFGASGFGRHDSSGHF